MKNWLKFFLLFVLLGSGCVQNETGEKTVANDARLRIVTTIYPLADITRQIAGSRAEVTALVPPGASPHTFEPTPGQVRQIADADVVVEIGIGLEFWLDKMITASSRRLTRVTLANEIEILGYEASHAGHDHDHSLGNPHIWLSPRMALKMVRQITAGLCQADSTNGAIYRKNEEMYLEKLRYLDEQYRRQLAEVTNHQFVATHAAWSYLARDYGLDQVAVLTDFVGQESTPNDVANLIDNVNTRGLTAIFVETQQSPKNAQALREETGLRIIELDPLGSPDFPERDTYVELMEYNLAQLISGLQNDK